MIIATEVFVSSKNFVSFRARAPEDIDRFHPYLFAG